MCTPKDTGLRPEVLEEIIGFAKKYEIKKLFLFGSRARGDFQRASDIDLAVQGGDITQFALDVDEFTSTLLKYDIVDLDSISQKDFFLSIEKEGILLYEKV